VSEQSVIAHPDAQAACNPPQENRDQQSFPREKEECGHRAHVKHCHEYGRDPIDFALTRLCSFQFLQFHCEGDSPVPSLKMSN
jgi:hypothetical protein